MQYVRASYIEFQLLVDEIRNIPQSFEQPRCCAVKNTVVIFFDCIEAVIASAGVKMMRLRNRLLQLA